MRNLLALLLFVPFIVMAQVPTYVPADGLVAWYPLDGNALDLSGLGHHGIVNGPMPSVDRFGNPNGAYHFNDASSISANLQGVGNGNVPRHNFILGSHRTDFHRCLIRSGGWGWGRTLQFGDCLWDG